MFSNQDGRVDSIYNVFAPNNNSAFQDFDLYGVNISVCEVINRLDVNLSLYGNHIVHI